MRFSRKVPAFGFGRVLVALSLVAVLCGFTLTCWRMVERQAEAAKSNSILARWGAAARLHGQEALSLNPGDTRPTWKEVQRRSDAWYNVLPPYQGELPLAAFAPEARNWSEALQRDRRYSLADMPKGGMHLAPGADYSEPERWEQRPVFAFVWNEDLQPGDYEGKPRVLIFEGLTHRADTAGHERVETRQVGHSLGGLKQAADRYRSGTGAVLTDGSLRRLPASELPW